MEYLKVFPFEDRLFVELDDFLDYLAFRIIEIKDEVPTDVLVGARLMFNYVRIAKTEAETQHLERKFNEGS